MKKKTKKEKQLAEVLSRIESAENWRDSNFKDLWRSYYMRWRSRPERERDGSNIFVPYTFMQCDVISSRILQSVFASRPYVTILPRGKATTEGAEKINSLIDWQLVDRIDINKVFSDELINDLVIYGTVISYTGWKKKTRTVKKRVSERVPLTSVDGIPVVDETTGEPVMVPTAPKVVESTEIVYDDPTVQGVDIFNFFVDKQASDLESARFCGHKEYKTRAELEELEKTAGYKIDWKKLDEISRVEDGRTVRYEDTGISGEDAANDNFGENSAGALFEVHHYWETNRHCVVLNRSQLVLDEENPFWHGCLPYDRICYIYLPHEFYGMGIVEITSSLQDELNTTRNQRIDYNSMALRRMWKLRKGCGLTSADLVWRQNGIVQVENTDDVQEINVADIPASAFANEANIKQDMRDATGCHDIIMGLSNTNETATTTMTKDNNASVRFKRVVETICSDMLVPIAKKIMSLDQQYLTEERIIRITGTKEEIESGVITSVSPWEIEGDYDLIYIGTAIDPMANKELNKQRLIEAVNVMFGDPLYQADPDARLNVYRRIFDTMEQKDITSLLPDETKFQQMQQQAQQQQQAMAQAQQQPLAPAQGMPQQAQEMAQI